MAYKDLLDPRNREAKLRHYYKNRQQYLERNRKKKTELKAYLREVKDVFCKDCGVKYPYYVMDFDHRRDKLMSISRLISFGLKMLKAEIAK